MLFKALPEKLQLNTICVKLKFLYNMFKFKNKSSYKYVQYVDGAFGGCYTDSEMLAGVTILIYFLSFTFKQNAVIIIGFKSEAKHTLQCVKSNSRHRLVSDNDGFGCGGQQVVFIKV